MLLLLDTPAGSVQKAGADLADPVSQGGVLRLPNDADPLALVTHGRLDALTRIELHFPKFTDGRAFSQAFILRRRLNFAGDLRATGDVLVDQLMQMRRSGFSSALLRVDQDLQVARRELARFDALGGFYQGDAIRSEPHFQPSKTSGAWI